MEVIIIFFKLILFTSEHNFSYTFSAYDRLIIQVTWLSEGHLLKPFYTNMYKNITSLYGFERTIL